MPAPAVTPVSAAARIPSPSLAAACSHLVAEDLGTAGSTRFVRCAECGSVLVVNARAVWRLDTPSGWPQPVPISASTEADDDPCYEMPEP